MLVDGAEEGQTTETVHTVPPPSDEAQKPESHSAPSLHDVPSGFFVGAAVGTGVGSLVGLGVGTGVGSFVGLGVGDIVGGTVGAGVVGDTVGPAVVGTGDDFDDFEPLSFDDFEPMVVLGLGEIVGKDLADLLPITKEGEVAVLKRTRTNGVTMSFMVVLWICWLLRCCIYTSYNTDL